MFLTAGHQMPFTLAGHRGTGAPARPMTPHSVGGSLNELGEARGTVLAVKLDRHGN